MDEQETKERDAIRNLFTQTAATLIDFGRAIVSGKLEDREVAINSASDLADLANAINELR